MNAQCSHCKTVFRVDPRKVPAGGVRARCSICRSVFEVMPEGATASATAASVSAPSAASTSAAAPVAAPTSAPTPRPAAVASPPAPAPPAPAPPRPAPSPAPAAAPAASPPPAPAPPAPAPAPAAGGSTRSPFGANDPQAKARRLARALVSDIVTYHPERRDKALQDGTLKREFMEEIKKSWEEYAGQVGTETARGTTFFRDALNEILAKGQPVF